MVERRMTPTSSMAGFLKSATKHDLPHLGFLRTPVLSGTISSMYLNKMPREEGAQMTKNRVRCW
jgi:hypothetical protein